MKTGQQVWLIRSESVIEATIKAVGDELAIVHFGNGETSVEVSELYASEVDALRVLNHMLKQKELSGVVRPFGPIEKRYRWTAQHGLFSSVYERIAY